MGTNKRISLFLMATVPLPSIRKAVDSLNKVSPLLRLYPNTIQIAPFPTLSLRGVFREVCGINEPVNNQLIVTF